MALVGILGSAIPVAPLIAATFVVNSAADTTNASCTPAPGVCTLRDAVNATVATPGRDTIVFDPVVFPLGQGNVIFLQTELPVMLDPAGTVIDGAAAGVVVDGTAIAAGNDRGLVIASGAGVPLVKPVVANITVQHFSTTGILICGGAPPGCDEDVTGALVQNVVAFSNGADGITIDGRENAKSQVIDSSAILNNSFGIYVSASLGQALVGARVRGCTASSNGFEGIVLNGAGANTKATVADSTAALNEQGVVVFAGSGMSGVKLTNVTASANREAGIVVQAGGALTGAAFSNVVASGSDLDGIEVVAGGQCAGVKMKQVTVAGSRFDGLNLYGGLGVIGAKITGVMAVDNGEDGIEINGGQSSLKQVHAARNAGRGIFLSAGPGGNKIEKSWAHGNTGGGIAVEAGNLNNTIQKNVALGSGLADLSDSTLGCDGNTWKKNVFRTRTQTCIQ